MAGETRHCTCGYALTEDARHCLAGHRQDGPTPEAAPTSGLQAGSLRDVPHASDVGALAFCPECGAAWGEGRTFCHRCGYHDREEGAAPVVAMASSPLPEGMTRVKGDPMPQQDQPRSVGKVETAGASAPPSPGWWRASDGNWYPPVQRAPRDPFKRPLSEVSDRDIAYGIYKNVKTIAKIIKFLFVLWLIGVVIIVVLYFLPYFVTSSRTSS